MVNSSIRTLDYIEFENYKAHGMQWRVVSQATTEQLVAYPPISRVQNIIIQLWSAYYQPANNGFLRISLENIYYPQYILFRVSIVFCCFPVDKMSDLDIPTKRHRMCEFVNRPTGFRDHDNVSNSFVKYSVVLILQ